MSSSHSQDHYIKWRKARIAKLEQVFGAEYFRGKTVLECGAGFGLVGKYIRENWGADVVFTEGREVLVNTIRLINPHTEAHLINHELPWSVNRHFDFIIHWGLLYHLNNWQRDLAYTLMHLNPHGVLTLESEVLDTEDDKEEKIEETAEDDQAVSGKGTRPSALRIENELRKHNVTFTRYDDADLNASIHKYDWKVGNTEESGPHHRRFWICYT